MDPSDDTLVQRIRDEGDMRAAEVLLTRYQNEVFGFLMTMLKKSHDAEDVLQETFTRALKGLGTYRESGQFRAWLYRIARNEAISLVRKRRRFVSMEPTIESPASYKEEPDEGTPRPDARLLAEENQRSFQKALEMLPPEEREVATMRLHGELSFKEIAAIVGCPLNTALGRMHNAKKRLRELLREDLVK